MDVGEAKWAKQVNHSKRFICRDDPSYELQLLDWVTMLVRNSGQLVIDGMDQFKFSVHSKVMKAEDEGQVTRGRKEPGNNDNGGKGFVLVLRGGANYQFRDCGKLPHFRNSRKSSHAIQIDDRSVGGGSRSYHRRGRSC